MSAEQMQRIAVAFARATASTGPRLCSACVDVLQVSGAGITVLGGDQAGPLCVSNERMGSLEDFQFLTGEGPCRVAYARRVPVLVSALDDDAAGRWPGFVELAVTAGIGAVFAYPLSTKGATVGVLTLYQDAIGALTDAQHDDSIALAEVLTETVLSWQDVSGDLPASFDDAVAYRAQIHQATGMVAVQLRISTNEALIRIRAYAFAHNQTVDVVAAAIVDRRLRLSNDRSDPRHGA